MCAALAARKDPAEELELAVKLMNEVTAGFESRGMRLGIHVCRGNWSRDESTLLSGSYHPLLPVLERMRLHQVVLEHATPRAGELLVVPGKELGLGVVNPRTDAVETADEVHARIAEALKLLPAERLFVNPDCGFGTFATRPMATPEVAEAKVAVMAEAARRARSAVVSGS
jgi:5-methyltetrahydropteroyltriglutamate--homocysteine methyltransferase